MTRSRDLADSADKDITGTLTVDAAIVQGDIAVTGTVDGIDIATRDAILTSTTTTAGAALPKAGGAMTGAITTNSTFDGVDVATRDAVLTSTTTTASAALPKAGGALTGAVTTNSTFDGRDVAADGVTADAALPKAGGAMTGAITTNSTFDGRDVAADGVLATNALPKSGGVMTGNLRIDTGNGNQLTLDNSGERFTQISFKNNSTQEAAIWYDATDNYLVAHTNAGDGFQVQTGGSTPRLTIDASGAATFSGTAVIDGTTLSKGVLNVGTQSGTSPGYFHSFLNVQSNASTTSNCSLTITAGNAVRAGLHFGDAQNGRIGQVAYDNQADKMEFVTNNTIRAAIDSSGKLLVGKTSSGYATTGVEIRPNEVLITKAGVNPLSVRNNGAGGLISLNSAGTTVGSIGVHGGSLVIGGGDVGIGLYQGANAIVPYNNITGLRGDAIDLGLAGDGRWKDLHLSGGVVFGPASASNVSSQTLSSYEEGTWTPSIVGSSGKTISATNYASYIKIGKQVHFQGYLNLAGTGNTVAFVVGGLPYTAQSNGYSVVACDIAKVAHGGVYARVPSSGSALDFLYWSGSINTDRQLLKGNDLGTTYMIFSGTYIAN